MTGVGGLTKRTTQNMLESHFSRFGPLLDVYIPKAPHSAQHRGFGFVTFQSEATAAQVRGRARTPSRFRAPR